MIYKDIWQSLENAASTQITGSVMRRIKPQAVCGLFLAVKQPSNQHMLQITLSTVPPTMIADLPTARGLDILAFHSEQSFLIQLTLRDNRFDKVFDVLIDDVIEVVSLANSEINALNAFISRLKHWQKFLEQVGPSGLSREEQQGLYGELCFLREHLIPLVGRSSAITAWKGPEGANQDFQLNACAIEVKTTGTKEPQQLIIQSERQLDDIGLTALFLFHLSVDTREGTGESLPMIVNSVRQLLKDDVLSSELYEDRLFEVGFLQIQESMYEKKRYNIRHESIFRVRDTFPRIIEADLRPGVASIRYAIMASTCQHFTVTEEDLRYQLIGQDHGE
jgi:hypothetical protein